MRKLVVIGGGELRNFSTLTADTFIRNLYTDTEKRPYALFVPTASHDSKPYFNTFRKTYCSKLGCKVDVALLSRNEMTLEHIAEKVGLADIIYVGGGDTAFMLDTWKKTGFLNLITDAYENGKIICGLSAGAICWFTKAHSDFMIMEGKSDEYAVINGLDILKGICVPHYDEPSRVEGLNKILSTCGDGYAIAADSAIYFEDEQPKKVIGSAYRIANCKVEKMSL